MHDSESHFLGLGPSMDMRLAPELALHQTAPQPARGPLALQMMQAALAHERLPQAAAGLCTALAQELAVPRVFLGVVQRRFCRVVALSHGTPLQGLQPVLRELALAMDESLDQGAHVAYPQHPDDHPRVVRAHAALVQKHGLGPLLTVPLFEQTRSVGALVFERQPGQLFDAAWAHQAQQLASALAPLLRLLIEREQGLLQRSAALLSRRWQGLPQAHQRVWRLGLPVLLVASVAAGFSRWTHDIAAPTRLEGRVQRALVVPMDGFLKSVHVRAGDTVIAGQLLAELVDDELRLELRRRQTEVAQHESAFGDAMARQDRAALVQAEARAAEARAQLGLIEAQLTRTRITAPFDGLVIHGDLQQQLAAPMRRGELLFTLTPSRELRVILQVDERDSAQLKPGMQGAVSFSALPERRFELVVDKVSPVARAEEGRNTFEAEARLLAPAPELMRPGMQGLAQLDAGQQPLAWLLTHRWLDWLRLQWWYWMA